MEAMTQPDVFYTAEFNDGPVAGDSEERVLSHGTYAENISVMALVDGLESIFRYKAVEARDIQGKLHVHYVFDEGHSDPYESEDENE